LYDYYFLTYQFACIFTISENFINIKLDELVKSPKTVIPAKAGIHKWLNSLDSVSSTEWQKGTKSTFDETIKLRFLVFYAGIEG
jgi:hypothetical protein